MTNYRIYFVEGGHEDVTRKTAICLRHGPAVTLSSLRVNDEIMLGDKIVTVQHVEKLTNE